MAIAALPVLAMADEGGADSRPAGNLTESAPVPPSPPLPPPAKPTAGWQDGFFLASSDGAFKLRIGGYIHIDSRWFLGDDSGALADQILLRRVRPELSGVLFQHFEFRLLPDFAGSKVVLQDVYVDANYHPAIRLRVGKFKVPFGLERLQSATAIEFVERGLPTNLVPNRDLGLQLWGDVGGGLLGWAVGLFNGVADGGVGDGDIGDDKEGAARIFVRPFAGAAPLLANLGVGGAVTYGTKEGTLANPELGSFKSAGQATFFAPVTGASLDATAVAHGAHIRTAGQAYYYGGPFGFLGELVFSSVEVAKGATRGRIDATSWQAALSWVVTGEAAGFNGVNPAAGYGAFEVAARYEELVVDSAAFTDGFADAAKSAKRARAFGGGVRWYLGRNIKVLVDFEHTDFEGGAATGDRAGENVVETRVQTVL